MNAALLFLCCITHATVLRMRSPRDLAGQNRLGNTVTQQMIAEPLKIGTYEIQVIGRMMRQLTLPKSVIHQLKRDMKHRNLIRIGSRKRPKRLSKFGRWYINKFKS